MFTSKDNRWSLFIRYRFFKHRKNFRLRGNLIRGSSFFWQGVWKNCFTFRMGINRVCGILVKLLGSG